MFEMTLTIKLTKAKIDIYTHKEGTRYGDMCVRCTRLFFMFLSDLPNRKKRITLFKMAKKREQNRKENEIKEFEMDFKQQKYVNIH